jgi:putative transposase
MTDTIDDVAAKAGRQEPVEPAIDKQSVAEQLVAQAREKGIELVGPNGLLSQLTKRVFETALGGRDERSSRLRQASSDRP